MANQATRVLLIEDNPGDADLVRLRLVESNSAVDVSCVNRLADGLAAMSKNPPALVLLDLNLPDSHGAETFRALLDKPHDVPVVILSGEDDKELAIKALHQGVQDYLVKDEITGNHLEHAMRYAVKRQAQLRSLEMSRKRYGRDHARQPAGRRDCRDRSSIASGSLQYARNRQIQCRESVGI